MLDSYHEPKIFENAIEMVSRLFLSKEQLAGILSVSPRTITGWRYKYKGFPAQKVGRHVRYNLPEVLRWLEETFGVQHGK